MKKILSITLSILLLMAATSGSVFAGQGNDKAPIKNLEYKRFHSQTQVSRLGVAATLAKNLELEPVTDLTENPFKDMNVSNEQYAYLVALYNAGIIKGYPDRNFNPNGIVNRGQMANIISGIFDEEDIESDDLESPTWTSGASITLTIVSASSVQLTWPDATDNIGVVQYKIYQNNDLIKTLNRDENECTMSGLVADKEYIFRIKAVDAEGNWSISLRKSYLTQI